MQSQQPASDALVNPAFVRTMAAYNAEMNRRVYAAAHRLSDDARRDARGAFWGSNSKLIKELEIEKRH